MKVNVQIDNQSFEVEVGDVNARPVVAVVDGETFEVWPEAAHEATDKRRAEPAATSDQPSRLAPAPAPSASGNGRVVRAPIPGVIVSVAVKPGDTVAAGQELCVLEAMKMKNAIRAGRGGQIAAVHVSTGQTVKHHDTLMEYAD